ncbi:hypothetical protein [uncultured Piscinibacter sp.]|uniref:hypothetical protein n=1 Tax=uncultured Piscinibacter sp. TaxID=1131835 RepID=UPI00260C5290|nr:hypothetical protein [uncultured Piscinibacter sp.]
MPAAHDHSDFKASTYLGAMICANLASERAAIDAYREMAQLIGDPTSRLLVEQIIADKQKHAQKLSEWLAA